MKAIWNNIIIADSEDTIVVEGNHYFPPGSVNSQWLRKSDTHSICPWKGEASYYDLVVDDAVNHDAAWYYPDPKKPADKIKQYIAFWHGVKIID